MKQKLTLMIAATLLLGVVFSINSVAWSFERQIPNRIPEDQIVSQPFEDFEKSGTYCEIYNDINSIGSYYPGYDSGMGVAVFMNPAHCGEFPYPFEITDVHFYLYEPDGDYHWPVAIRVNIRDSNQGDSCSGPQDVLCFEDFSVPRDLAYPLMMTLNLSNPCCVNQPFFLEIIYTEPRDPDHPHPSPLMDVYTAPADTCDNWVLHSDGQYYEWYNYWTSPPPGDAIIRATGYTGAECEDLWPNHKMHFPQEPDLEGWDVFAVDPKTLADDWQCSETGWVTDIHFWGSWKDLDGDPDSDDFQTPMPFFNLSIHRNIPADPDTPWSRPGELVWFWEGEIGGTPFEPPAMEHWFNPNTGEVLYNDHVPYWRYDFFVEQASPPADSFFQYEDSIYWLNVSAVYIEPPYEWGWKSSRDHFMDDAVYRDDVPGTPTPWIEMYEPPRYNEFSVVFGSDGRPIVWHGTNYYGEGFYEYEYWWNMWFYDNPFTYDHPKQGVIDFFVEPTGPSAFLEFAINWSSDLWSLVGVPGRPPLPGPEEVYVERQIIGPLDPMGQYKFSIDIPYNPEWISVDFAAADVAIYGSTYHECVGTSLDLAFVITGHAAPPNNPPEIGQPDFLEGYVDSVVEYDITGTDPDGDVILDEASIEIIPGCGSEYTITRSSGHGTSTGTWQITWYTDGCTPCDTHMVIHDLTDEYGAVGYCTTWVHLSEWVDTLWYWKPDKPEQEPFPAPSGMPDFDQNQDAWVAYCGPTAVANCLWWFNSVPVGMTPPQLIELLAGYFHTNPTWGTYVDTMQMGLDQYFEDYRFELQETTFVEPDFYEMEDSLKVCQDIILLIGFWWSPDGYEWYREGGHFVTMAGVCSESLKIAISDPDNDGAVGGAPGRVRPPTHPPPGQYGPTLHNDPTYVSHDIYDCDLAPEFPSPGNPHWEINYPWPAPGKYTGMNVPDKFRDVSSPAPKNVDFYATEVEYAVMICPKPSNAVEGEEQGGLTPKDFELYQNYPNPFNNETVIKFNLRKSAEVTLVVYNVLGQKVRTLVKGRMDAGSQSVSWDGKDEKGNELSSGIYFYQLKAGEVKETKRLVLLK